jgi:hypothetical protein
MADAQRLCPEGAAQWAAQGAAKVPGVMAEPKEKAKGKKAATRLQITACLTANEAKLTPECKTALEERKAVVKAAKKG